jgi:lipid-binding SYLF domain-containing protein
MYAVVSQRFLQSSAVVLVALLTAPLQADWQPERSDSRQLKAAAAIDEIRAGNPAAAPFLEEAYGLAILPRVTRAAVGFGGATGSGLVIEGDIIIGTTRFWQLSGGIQGGVKTFRMIVIFKNKAALDEFTSGRLQFAGQAGVDIAAWGVHGTPSWNDGVAVFVDTELGLMAEFAYSGIRFSFRPLPKS